MIFYSKTFLLCCLQLMIGLSEELNYHDIGKGKTHATIGRYPFINMDSCGYVIPADKASGPKKMMRTQSAKPRIIEGAIASPGDYPWMAAIHHKLRRVNDTYVCGAALIHEFWVLTAKHCIEPPGQSPLAPNVLMVVVGTVMKDEFPVGRTFNVSHYEPSPAADLALVRLEKPVSIERWGNNSRYHVNFICLPEINIVNTHSEDALISGFGQSTLPNQWSPSSGNTVLREMAVLIDSVEECRSRNVTADFLCATPLDTRHTCHGDSGSGVVQYDGSRAVLIGIVSGFDKIIGTGQNPCSRQLMRFQRVSYFIQQYIAEVISRNKTAPEPTAPNRPPGGEPYPGGPLPDPDKPSGNGIISRLDSNSFAKSILLLNIVLMVANFL